MTTSCALKGSTQSAHCSAPSLTSRFPFGGDSPAYGDFVYLLPDLNVETAPTINCLVYFHYIWHGVDTSARTSAQCLCACPRDKSTGRSQLVLPGSCSCNGESFQLVFHRDNLGKTDIGSQR